MDEGQILGEALMRVCVQLPIKGSIRVGLGDNLAEVPLQIGAREYGDGVPTDLLESARLFCAEIPTSEFVVPGAIRKLRDGLGIYIFDLTRHSILFEERG